MTWTTLKSSLWYSLRLLVMLAVEIVYLSWTITSTVWRITRTVATRINGRVWRLAVRALLGAVAVASLVAAYLFLSGGPDDADEAWLDDLYARSSVGWDDADWSFDWRGESEPEPEPVTVDVPDIGESQPAVEKVDD